MLVETSLCLSVSDLEHWVSVQRFLPCGQRKKKKKKVNIAFVSLGVLIPRFPREVLMPEASPLHFNILSAVICSLRLTRRMSPPPLVPAPRPRRACNSPKSSASNFTAHRPDTPQPRGSSPSSKPATAADASPRNPRPTPPLLFINRPLSNRKSSRSTSAGSKEQTHKSQNANQTAEITAALVAWILN